MGYPVVAREAEGVYSVIGRHMPSSSSSVLVAPRVLTPCQPVERLTFCVTFMRCFGPQSPLEMTSTPPAPSLSAGLEVTTTVCSCLKCHVQAAYAYRWLFAQELLGAATKAQLFSNNNCATLRTQPARCVSYISRSSDHWLF